MHGPTTPYVVSLNLEKGTSCKKELKKEQTFCLQFLIKNINNNKNKYNNIYIL